MQGSILVIPDPELPAFCHPGTTGILWVVTLLRAWVKQLPVARSFQLAQRDGQILLVTPPRHQFCVDRPDGDRFIPPYLVAACLRTLCQTEGAPVVRVWLSFLLSSMALAAGPPALLFRFDR